MTCNVCPLKQIVLTHTLSAGTRCRHGEYLIRVKPTSFSSLPRPWWALSLGGCLTVVGADPAPDKRQYTLFHPVPTALMRPMSLDRPDKTESPFTVDAGHFQLEMDLVNYAHDSESTDTGRVITQALAVAPMNWKVGLANSIDFQVVIQTYNRLRLQTPESETVQSGFGDIVNRLKINLWGNEGGPTALAVMPYVAWPTSQDDLGVPTVEGGIIVPLAIELPAEFGLGLMTQVDFLRSNSHRVAAAFVNTITLGRPIYGDLSGYVEFFSEVPPDDEPWVGTLDFGLTFALTDNLQLDGGLNIGVTRSAPDWNPFLGLSCRF